MYNTPIATSKKIQPKATTKEIFVQEVNRLWSDLKDRDDTIFENVAIHLDAEGKYEIFRENDQVTFMSLMSESSVYEKKKIISVYFWDQIVGDLYEDTLIVMKANGLLEEALASFDKTYKIEKTAELILEKGVFANFESNKKKELVNEILEMTFYPASFYQNNQGPMDDNTLEEAGFLAPAINWTGDRIRDIARMAKNIQQILIYVLISPVTILGASTAAIGDKIGQRYDQRGPTGMSPTSRKFYEVVESFSPANLIFKFINKDLYDVSNLLQRTNNLENDELQEVLREMKADPNKMVAKCWEKNRFQLDSGNPSQKKVGELMGHFFSGKGLSNMLRNPMYGNETQLTIILKNDAGNAQYQKMFYDFRVCLYEKLFEIILGYAKTIYSMDDASYEIIKIANDAHESKNFKQFFDLKPKQVNEEAMFKIMRALVAIDSISYGLEKRKGNLVADKYIDKFADFLRLNTNQVYGELNEMANQRKYNEDRYADDVPDEETKSAAIQAERFEARKSIFDTEKQDHEYKPDDRDNRDRY